MRIAVAVFIVLIISATIVAVRGDADFPLVQALPFLRGRGKPENYEWAGVAMLAITAWGIGRLYRKSDE